MPEPYTPAELEAGAQVAAQSIADFYSPGSAEPLAVVLARAMLRAVLPDHDARVRADERARVAEEIAQAIQEGLDYGGRDTEDARRIAAAIARRHANPPTTEGTEAECGDSTNGRAGRAPAPKSGGHRSNGTAPASATTAGPDSALSAETTTAHICQRAMAETTSALAVPPTRQLRPPPHPPPRRTTVAYDQAASDWQRDFQEAQGRIAAVLADLDAMPPHADLRTHYGDCWRVHAGCLAARIRRTLTREDAHRD